MYEIELAGAYIFEAELGGLKKACEKIAKCLTDRELPFQGVERISFIGRGKDIEFNIMARLQMESDIDNCILEIYEREKEYAKYNKYPEHFTDLHC